MTLLGTFATVAGTFGVALIGKSDLFFNKSDVEPALAVQKHKYEQVSSELDGDLSEIESETEALNREALPAEEKAEKYNALREVREKVIAVESSLPEQFATYERHIGIISFLKK